MSLGLTSLLALLESNPAMTSSFVHLHLQIQFNLPDGANQILETVAVIMVLMPGVSSVTPAGGTEPAVTTESAAFLTPAHASMV